MPFGGLAVALLVGGWLRCCNLQESLWVDELHTSWTVRGTWPELIGRAAWGNQPPLYFAVAKICVLLGGESETAIRMPSLLAGLAVVGLGSFFVLRLTQRPYLAAVAAWLLALDPELTFYAQEARPYAFVQLGLLIHVLFFARRLPWRRRSGNAADRRNREGRDQSSNRPSWTVRIGWIASLWFAFYCHYTALIVLSWESLVLLSLAISGRIDRRLWRFFAIDLGILVVGLLPAAVHVLAIARRQSDWGVLVQLWPLPMQLTEVIVFYLFPAMVIALLGWLWKSRPQDDSAKKLPRVTSPVSTAFVVGWGGALLGTVLGLWMASRLLGVAWFMPRYFIGLWPLIVVFPALVLSRVSSRSIRGCGVVLLLFVVAVENPMVNAPAGERCRAISRGENWRDAIASLSAAPPSVTTLFVFPNLVEDNRIDEQASDELMAYLAFPVQAMYELPTENRSRELEVAIRSLRGEPIFRDADITRMLADGQALLLVRGRDDDVVWIIERLNDHLAPSGRTCDAWVDPFGSVFVVQVNFVTPDELKALESDGERK